MSDKLAKRIAYFYFFGFLLAFAALRPIGLDPDSAAYRDWILRGIYYERAELFFILCVDFWKLILPLEYVPRAVLATFAFIQMYILHLALTNYRSTLCRSLLLYFLLLYSIALLTQIRVGVASAIFFWAIRDIGEKNILRFISKIALAFTFHSMSLVFFVFYFLNPKKINSRLYWCALPIGLCFIFFLNSIKGFVLGNVIQYLPRLASLKVGSYLSADEHGMNIFNFWFLYVLLLYYLALYALKTLPKECILYVKVVGLGIVLYFPFSIIWDLAIRTMNSVGLLVLVLIPMLANAYRPKYLSVAMFYGAAIFIFLNLNFRNQLLDLEVFFQ